MPEVIQILFNGLSNTRDTVLVGQNGIFSMDAVKVDNSILEAENGYSVQIAVGSSSGQGVGFGRFGGTEEFIKIDNGDVFVAAPGASVWTQIATAVGAGKWFFDQQGDTIYAVNEGSAGLARHVIGSGVWTQATSTAPGSGDALFPVEAWFNFTQTASGWYNIGSLADIASGWVVDQTTGNVSPDPTYDQLKQNVWLFDLNRNYSLDPDGLKFTFTFDTPQDFSEAHHWKPQFQTNFETLSIFVDDNLFMEFEDSAGNAIIPTSQGTQFTSPHSRRAFCNRHFYFAGLDDKLADVKKIHLWCMFDAFFGTGAAAQIELSLRRGSVAMNDTASVDFDAGPIVDQIRYRSSVVSAGAESNLSLVTGTSPFVSSAPVMPSLFMRVGLDTVATAASGDTLNVYREAKLTGIWSLVGSALNTGAAFKNTNKAGTLFVDDNYQEWELADRDPFSAGFQLDINETTTQAIGSFKASLCIGAGTNLYVSKVALPTQFEDINSAPNPNDFNQGRSVFVDKTQNEDVNMIVGLDVLYVGTKSRVYVLVPRGDGFPKDFTSPRPITNSGPIGPRAFSVFEDGVVYVDRNAVWYVRYNGETTVDDTGAVQALELTADVRTTFDELSVDEDVVAVVQDGDLLVFQGTKYMRYERINKRWTSGTLNHTIIDAVPDYLNDLRLLTDDGKLLRWDNGTDFGGTAIAWSATIGDIVVPRSRVLHVRVIAEGAPVMTLVAFDGLMPSKTQVLTLEVDENIVNPFQVSLAYGSRYRVSFTGDNAAKVKGLEFVYELLNAGKAR